MDVDSPDRRSILPRPAGRSSIPLVVNKEGRQSLFPKRSRESLQGESRPSFGRNAYSDGTALTAIADNDRFSGAVSPTSSLASSNGEGSRIPRPHSSAGVFSKARRQISLTEAYRMAEAEEDRAASAPRTLRLSPAPVDGSPSPAPRPRPGSRSSNDRQTHFNAALKKTPQPLRYSDTHLRHDDTVRSTSSLSSSSSFERRFGQFADEQRGPMRSPSPRINSSDADRRSSGLFGAGRSLSKRSSTSSLNERPQTPAFSKGHVPKGWVAHLLAQEEQRGAAGNGPRSPVTKHAADVPIRSVETDSPQVPTPPSSRPASADVVEPSPNKSYGWQLDQDFTAGDLTVSDSPRISTTNTGSNGNRPGQGQRESYGNSKLDEIRRRELEWREATLASDREPEPKLKNTKLDDIRQREHDLEHAFAGHQETEELPPPKNSKLDEIKAREEALMSKRALASNRLDDIRERNSMSRSLSPENQRHPKPRSSDTKGDVVSSGPSLSTKGDGSSKDRVPEPEIPEKAPDAPSDQASAPISRGGDSKTVLEQPAPTPAEVKSDQTSPARVRLSPVRPAAKPEETSSVARPDEAAPAAIVRKEPFHKRHGSGHARSDSRDLLRKLSRAASASPGPANDRHDRDETKQPPKDANDVADKAKDSLHPGNLMPTAPTEKSSSRAEESKDAPRSSSNESSKDKRSSRALSDIDPTDRIEGEMKLFALGDNQSERGSVRAPSVGPPSEDDDEDDDDDEDHDLSEATPRPLKRDVMTMPTPKVVGAYFDTPLVAKTEERLDVDLPMHKEPAATAKSQRANVDRSTSRPRSKLHVTETHEEDGTSRSTQLDMESKSAGPTGLRRRRTRSLPRTRGPLINSVKPPTVRDDLLDIQRTYQIEDSTLDDFEQLLAGNKTQLAPSSDIDGLLTEISLKQQEIRADPDRDNSELERYDRMSKTLTDGLLGIRTAKKGIERLEGNLVHSDHQPVVKTEPKATSELAQAAPQPSTSTARKPNKIAQLSCDEATQAVNHVRLPLPSMYTRKPFRFTLLGSILLALALWFVAETAMCAQYCRPKSCSPTSGPCIWEPTDPFWGYAIPVKLDQWISNGQGRRLYEQWSEDLSDKYLDVWDQISGTSIRDVNIEHLDVYGKRQHRRRLRKHGLINPVQATAEQKAKWDAAHEARLAMERTRELREAGYDVEEVESFAADEAI